MEHVIEALKQYDRNLWRAMNSLRNQTETKEVERPPAGLPSKQLYDRCPSQHAWKDSLR